jgi:hypothetical protein
MKQTKIIDILANQSHISWSNWMKYLFELCEQQQDGTVIIPKILVERWKRQINTSYEDLSLEEQSSDKLEAIKYIKLLETYFEEKYNQKIL